MFLAGLLVKPEQVHGGAVIQVGNRNNEPPQGRLATVADTGIDL